MLGVALLVALGACASTKITSVYRSDDWAGGPFRSLMVVGLSPNDGTRALFEERFARGLTAHGVDATQSVEVMPQHGDLTRAHVEAWVREKRIDGVIVTHLVDVERQTEVVPPTVYPSLYGYYGYAWGTMVPVSPGYVRENTVLRLETNLYDAQSAKLVWSARSRSFNPSDREEVVKDLVPRLVNRLTDDGLLPDHG